MSTRSDSSATPRMRTASRPAFLALSIATVATGTPAGICTMDSSESIPSSRLSATGTPITGSAVTLANIPDQAVNGMQGFFFNLRRLKYKLGTRSMASSEIDFVGAVAYPVADFRNLPNPHHIGNQLHVDRACFWPIRKMYRFPLGKRRVNFLGDKRQNG